MTTDHGINGNERLEALRKREAALREQIAAEQSRLQKRRERIHTKHASIAGACLLADFEHNPQLAQLLEEILKRHANPRDLDFLRARGWRI
jgi:transposase